MTGVPSENFVKSWLPKFEQSRYLLTGANIVDPVEGRIHENSSILLESGNIVAVKYNGEIIKEVTDAKKLNVEGKYVCPGLIDNHVHIAAVPGELNFRHMVATPQEEAMLRMTFVCRDMLSRGFTTVRDCGGAPYALKQACESCSGFVSGLGRICDGVPECMRVARDELRCGADFIKIMGGGGVVSPTDRLMNKQYSPEEIQAMVLVAENAHTHVTCHAYTPESIQTAIMNVVKGIELGNLMDRPTAKMMAERGCFLTPTLVTYQTLADLSLPQFLSGDCASKNQTVLSMGLDALRIAKEEGILMCYGSDMLGPLGVYQLKEFGIRSQVLTALEILQSATINPAKMLREDIGRIAPNYKADLLVLGSNPLSDITVFERPEQELLCVIKDGRICRSRLHGVSGLLDGFAKL